MNYLDNRIIKARCKLLCEHPAALITSDISRRYIFGFNSSAGYGYISNNKCVLFLDFRYFEKAKIMQREGKISSLVEIREMTSPRKENITELLKEDCADTLLFEDKSVTYSEYIKLCDELGGVSTLVPAGNNVEALRYSKDEYELELIQKAQDITDKAFTYILGFIKPGLTEKDVSAELESFILKCGADRLAFNTICVSGTKSSLPHGEGDTTVIGKGFLTLDFGAKYMGYCSDMTRTICIGKPTDDMLRVYNTVREAQETAFSKIKAGVDGFCVDEAARNVIYNAGYKGCFGHSTGHSLGLEVHELPGFSPSVHNTVPQGAVVSVEPGIYLQGKYGVRIEDIVFLTENGYKNLTNSTKDIIIIE